MRWVQSVGNKKYECSFAQKIYAAVFSTKT
jgi:hypothetical protein